MIDPLPFADPPGGDEASVGPQEVEPGSRQAATPSTTPSVDNRRRPKRTGPIVNRRGPSEIDRAIKMSQAASGRAAPPPRKVGGATSSRGTVIRIDRAKGFGFLIDLAGEQRFFHRSAVLDDGFTGLKEQQAVDFEPLADERGARAINVRPAGSSSRATKPAQRSQPSSKATKTPAWRSDLSPFRNGTGAPTPGRKR